MTETAVQEKPILFSGAMVRAILEGRKTQTRRVCALQDDKDYKHGGAMWTELQKLDRCPYGKPGTHLWVRETFTVGWLDGGKVLYRADGGSAKKAGYPAEPVYKPSIHMPRWASRLTLEIINVKVERVQDVSTGDCYAEGIDRPKGPIFGSEVTERDNARGSFRTLWDSINSDRDYGWENNPFVWAIEFKRLEGKR